MNTNFFTVFSFDFLRCIFFFFFEKCFLDAAAYILSYLAKMSNSVRYTTVSHWIRSHSIEALKFLEIYQFIQNKQKLKYIRNYRCKWTREAMLFFYFGDDNLVNQLALFDFEWFLFWIFTKINIQKYNICNSHMAS